MNGAYALVLFPGRHHAVTRFQVQRLREITAEGPAAGALVVWAVTSANHGSTRRNPLPGHRREALVTQVVTAADLPGAVVPVPDVPAHPRFSELVTTTVATSLPHLPEVTPSTTLVACSTPAVAADYAARGFTVVGVEDTVEPRAAGPWQVVEMLAAGDPSWSGVAHPETVRFYERYDVVSTVPALFADPVVSDDGDLTETRDYRTYKAAFENASHRKLEIVGPHLRPGRLLDIGCASGGLLELVAAEPAFAESDLFGVDVARPLLAEADHKKASGAFVNPNVWFLRANILSGPVMPERSVDCSVSLALTHEVFSYGAGRADVELFAQRVLAHTRPGGVWVNSDVVGPEDPDRLVVLTLRTDDGTPLAAPRTDLDELDRDGVAAVVEELSTDARMVQFAHDFPRLSGADWRAEPLGEGRWRLRLADAMEFLTTKDYTDNWLSECHEQFCGLSPTGWEELLGAAGFTLRPGSGGTRNDWLVEHRFAPVASLADAETGEPVDWPVTHVLTVAERPLG